MKYTKRILSLLLSLILVLGLLPAGVLAADNESISVNIQFDCRSIATDKMMTARKISYPTSQTVTVPNGSTVYTALKAAIDQQENLSAVFGKGYDGAENGYLVSLGDIGSGMEALCDKTGASYSHDIFQNAGWTYSGSNVDGAGIQVD